MSISHTGSKTRLLLENLRFLRPTAKFKFAKDQYLMVGQVMRQAADEIERLQAALKRASEDLTCGGQGIGTHYCPNCDNSLFSAAERVNAALSDDQQLTGGKP